MKDRRLIINADDLGYDPAVTRGILEAMRTGVVSSATLMVNTPFSEDAAREATGLSLGLHLNLARHPPVSNAIPRALLGDGGFDERRAGELPADAVEAETLAQLDRLQALTGKRATHIDVHKHLHTLPRVFEGLCRAAATRKLPVRAIDARMRLALHTRGIATTDAFIGDAGAEAYWTMSQLSTSLEQLPEGVTELMCHPGYAPSHTRSGYSSQREVELATFVHHGARKLLSTQGIALVDFTVLAR